MIDLGGSEIGAAAGLSPWCSPLALALRKLGKVPAFEDNAATNWGRRLEEPIARHYADLHGVSLEVPLPGHSMTRPWMRASPDRLVAATDASQRPMLGLEIKTANHWQGHRWGESGSQQVPDEYAAQCHWYMSVCDIQEWDLVVLLDTADYREYRIHRDPKVEEALIEIGERFVRTLDRGELPAMDGSDAATKWLVKRFPRAAEPLLKSTEETDRLAEELRELRECREAAEASEAEVENRLKELIGPARGVEGEWGTITWGERRAPERTDWASFAAAVGQELGPERVAKMLAEFTSRGENTRAFTPRFK